MATFMYISRIFLFREDRGLGPDQRQTKRDQHARQANIKATTVVFRSKEITQSTLSDLLIAPTLALAIHGATLTRTAAMLL